MKLRALLAILPATLSADEFSDLPDDISSRLNIHAKLNSAPAAEILESLNTLYDRVEALRKRNKNNEGTNKLFFFLSGVLKHCDRDSSKLDEELDYVAHVRLLRNIYLEYYNAKKFFSKQLKKKQTIKEFFKTLRTSAGTQDQDRLIREAVETLLAKAMSEDDVAIKRDFLVLLLQGFQQYWQRRYPSEAPVAARMAKRVDLETALTQLRASADISVVLADLAKRCGMNIEVSIAHSLQKDQEDRVASTKKATGVRKPSSHKVSPDQEIIYQQAQIQYLTANNAYQAVQIEKISAELEALSKQSAQDPMMVAWISARSERLQTEIRSREESIKKNHEDIQRRSQKIEGERAKLKDGSDKLLMPATRPTLLAEDIQRKTAIFTMLSAVSFSGGETRTYIDTLKAIAQAVFENWKIDRSRHSSAEENLMIYAQNIVYADSTDVILKNVEEILQLRIATGSSYHVVPLWIMAMQEFFTMPQAKPSALHETIINSFDALARDDIQVTREALQIEELLRALLNQSGQEALQFNQVTEILQNLNQLVIANRDFMNVSHAYLQGTFVDELNGRLLNDKLILPSTLSKVLVLYVFLVLGRPDLLKPLKDLPIPKLLQDTFGFSKSFSEALASEMQSVFDKSKSQRYSSAAASGAPIADTTAAAAAAARVTARATR